MKQIKVKIKENIQNSTLSENEMCKIILYTLNNEEITIYNKYIYNFEINGITENICKIHPIEPTKRYKTCNYFKLELYPEADDLYNESSLTLFQRLEYFADIIAIKVIFADNGKIISEYVKLPCNISQLMNNCLVFSTVHSCNNFRIIASNCD